MLIIGAGGLAKEILEIFHQQNELDGLFFYDGVSPNPPGKLFDRFGVLTTDEQVTALFHQDNKFTIGVGKPVLRKQLFEKFSALGGQLVSAISPFSHIGHFGTTIGRGAIIMSGTVITNDVKIGLAALINPNCVISHDTVIGDFVEISPGVKITGQCRVGNLCNVGTNATLLPGVAVGNGAVIGAGAVVNKPVLADTTVVGVPAKNISRN